MDPPPALESIVKTAVVVENIPSNWVREDVEKHFSSWGGVERLTYISKKELALVTYNSNISAEKAVALNGTTPEGQQHPIKVSFTEKQANSDSSRVGMKKRRSRPQKSNQPSDLPADNNNNLEKNDVTTVTNEKTEQAAEQKEVIPPTESPPPEEQKNEQSAEKEADIPEETISTKQRIKRQKREKKIRVSNLAGSFIDEAF